MRERLRERVGAGRGVWLRSAIAAGIMLGLAVPAHALVPLTPRGQAATAAAGAPRCTYSFYDVKADAPGLSGQQANQLDLVEGVFGLNSAHTKLRVVMTIRNLSKAIPAPANYTDYLIYWTNPSGDSGPNAVDATVNSAGKVTFTDGTVTVVNGNTQYSASPTSSAIGRFGHGPNGKIEIDVPLSQLHLKVGNVLSRPVGETASGASGPVGSIGSVSDSDKGKAYKLGQATCINRRR